MFLSLANTVQNAIIGDDNSLLAASSEPFTLLATNWIVVRILYGSPELNRALGVVERTLIREGRVDNYALKKELLSREDLLTVVHRQGFEDFHEVAHCVLEPNGAFYVEGRKPSADEDRQKILLDRLDEVTQELKALRAKIG